VSKLDYKIVNRVAVGNLGSNLDLFNVAVALPNVEYEPEQFPGAIMRLKEPKMTITLFKNGKINCAGAAKDSDIPKGIINASKILHEIIPELKVPKDPPYRIVNIVANAYIDRQIDLFELAIQLDNVEYEPEQFPGAIVRLYDPKVSLLLFKNGKLICAGARSEDEVKAALKKIDKIIADLE
jgi:transcription initiation factor TFIID TATA-box-binding protein